MILVDTHCHLDFEKFDPDRSEVLRRAREAGVERILIPGLTAASSRSVAELAASHPMLYASVGVHPTEAGTWGGGTRRQLESLALQHPSSFGEAKIAAIGEIGLDYYWNTAPHDLQKNALREQLDLAAGLGLPVVLHFREKGDALHGKCAEGLLQILEEWTAGLRREASPLAERPGVLHSFSGSLETARAAIALGFYLGVTGPVTYPRAVARQEIVARLPLGSLLIETDAPFLSPDPMRGGRNEPAFVRLIADKIALLHSCTIEEVAAITSENARRLFQWKETD